MIPTYIRRNLSVKISDVITARQQNRPYQYEKELINYVTNIQFTSTMPGGFATCTIGLIYAPDVDWTVMRPGNEVRIWDGGNILWEGRVEDPGTLTSRSGSGFDVICTGHIARLNDDKIFRACFVDSAFDSWEQRAAEKDIIRRNGQSEKSADDKFDTECGRFWYQLFVDNDKEFPNRLAIIAKKGQYFEAYNSGKISYSLLGGFPGRNSIEDPTKITEKIQRIKFSYDLDLDSAGHWRAEIVSRAGKNQSSDYMDDVFVRQAGYPKVGGGTGTFSDGERVQNDCLIDFDGNPKPCRFLDMRLVHACTEGEMTGDHVEMIGQKRNISYEENVRFRINKMRVVATTITPVTVRSVFEYVAAPLFNNFVADDYLDDHWNDITEDLDQFVEDGPIDRASVLERANMVDVWDYACWDWGNFYYSDPEKEQNRSGMNLYVSSYDDPHAVWRVALNYGDYLNEILVRYTDASGQEREVICPSNDGDYEVASVVRPLHGITRRGTLTIPSDGKVSKSFARKVARRYLHEHSRPIITGTVEVSGPLKTASGAMMEPWRIRAGQYITNKDIQSGFGGTRMKIIQVDVDMSTGTATLTLGRRRASRIDELFAQMAAQQRRRWRKNKL